MLTGGPLLVLALALGAPTGHNEAAPELAQAGLETPSVRDLPGAGADGAAPCPWYTRAARRQPSAVVLATAVLALALRPPAGVRTRTKTPHSGPPAPRLRGTP